MPIAFRCQLRNVNKVNTLVRQATGVVSETEIRTCCDFKLPS